MDENAPIQIVKADARQWIVKQFDSAFYRKQLREAGVHPLPQRALRHYLEEGWIAGFDPSPRFSTELYLALHEDARAAGCAPLEYHASIGRFRGAEIPPSDRSVGAGIASVETMMSQLRELFDEEYYREQLPLPFDGDLLEHYLQSGWRQGLNPSPSFETEYYLGANPDVAESGINPLLHFVRHGRAEGRRTACPPGEEANKEDPGDAAVSQQEPISQSLPEGDPAAALFDPAYYAAQLESVPDGASLYRHFMDSGWRQRLDPSPDFSTSYYLETNPEVAAAGINPFLHWVNYGRYEKRPAVPYHRQPDFSPLVSVIVPNYNHARFLEQRLQSIFAQTYRNIEMIVLDDASTDDSREVIARLLEQCPFPCRIAFNDRGTGSPFRQWQRGLAMAQGELIWICESDDFADSRFLEHLVPGFADLSVKMALGRIEFCRADGTPTAGMAGFRDGAEPGIWDKEVVRPAAQWFRSAFAKRNIVTNVGGCVFRNQQVDDEIWDRAAQFRIAGDWFLYIHLLGGGKLAYHPDAISYFRQHEANTSARNFDKLYYYEECWAVQQEIRRFWRVDEAAGVRFVEDLAHQYKHFAVDREHGRFEDRYSTASLMPTGKRAPHIAIGFLGFETGGGELFPLLLANEYARQGLMVSLIAANLTDRNDDMVARLDPRVAVYSRDDMFPAGPAALLDRAGFDVIHSHSVLIENLFFERGGVLNSPYVVSMHGSHNLPGGALDRLLFRSLRNVDYWVYTAEKNLDVFAGIPLDRTRFIKMANGMPRDLREVPFTRASLGIGEDATVFTFVARGIQRKGWRASVEAFQMLKARHPDREMHLLMIGEGRFADRSREIAAGDPAIHYLGYQSCINGIYRMSDCALVPTRFEGESFPLCVIQALQEGCPVLGNDVGEIRSMLTSDKGVAGAVTNNMRDTAGFIHLVAETMEQFLDPDFRASARELTAEVAGRFSMEACAAAYRALYDQAIAMRP
ncbi:glycosyltransferase [Sphingomonas sp. IC-11]|uniref:glycosyltransferase n=1 Tax=Sphingomonas sp. IC-11 TaxID=2898528 RepID=UPI001E497812|nr:glycosyltransferase [Sphingomonas sp. IC-11]